MDLIKFENTDILEHDVVITLKMKELLTLYSIVGEIDVVDMSRRIQSNAEHLERKTGFNMNKIADMFASDQTAVKLYDEMSSIIDDIGNELS